MRRKLKIAAVVALIIWIASALISWWLFAVLTLCGCLALASIIVAWKINNRLKLSNWYNNQFRFTKQFVSNAGYRDNIIRNYDVVNLGSNPAVYGFFYEGVKGQSWATGSQGLDMDFEILKCYHSYIKDGGTVIIPIMPFSAISPYIRTKKGYWNAAYYEKFSKVIFSPAASKFPFAAERAKMRNYPLLCNPRAFVYAFNDVSKDQRYEIDHQPMMTMELMQDAKWWMQLWYKEFDLKGINDVLNQRWDSWIEESSAIMSEMIDYCLERGYKPALVYLPTTKYLASEFTPEAKNRLLYDFVKKVNKKNVPFLDYSNVEELQDESLYYNSFFLNMHGRKLFTKRVLKDLELI